mmetsp:Transcript_6639/g.24452  ORF Transcript_6639/g.24452 Transcript_6639/m.24452 type:complete len:327 (-) Transcript_6639:1159-2139(-)
MTSLSRSALPPFSPNAGQSSKIASRRFARERITAILFTHALASHPHRRHTPRSRSYSARLSFDALFVCESISKHSREQYKSALHDSTAAFAVACASAGVAFVGAAAATATTATAAGAARTRMHCKHSGSPLPLTGSSRSSTSLPVRPHRTATGRHSAFSGIGFRFPSPCRVVDFPSPAAPPPPPPPFLLSMLIAPSVSFTGDRVATCACDNLFLSAAYSASISLTNVHAASIAGGSFRSDGGNASSSAASDTATAGGTPRRVDPLIASAITAAMRRTSFCAKLSPRGAEPSSRECKCTRPVCGESSNHKSLGGGGSASAESPPSSP